jgi:rhamnosyltransferase
MIKNSVVAVVVTYHPELFVLQKLLEGLNGQVQSIVIVDNGTSELVLQRMQDHIPASCTVIRLGRNQGIGAAQNVGIRYAKDAGATHVILFDHDSAPAPDMVERLLVCMNRIESGGVKVACVGPRYNDERQDNPPPFIQVKGISLTRRLVPEDGDAAEVDYLIASGCLIKIKALDEVGLMDEALFIDYVDIEWGQRARSLGWKNFGCFSALMQHSLGDDPIVFLGHAYPARSPLRHYYMFRNAVLLYKMPHIPLGWKIADGMRGVLRCGFYVLLAKPRLMHLRMIAKGIWHGCCGENGQYVS